MFLLTACNDSTTTQAGSEKIVTRYPEFEQAQLKLGRSIWLENCKACHGSGLAGAPVIGNKKQWRERIAKGKTTLFQHALNGYQGPSGTEMPARGGNDALTDDEVKSAVEYMLTLSQ